MSVLALHVELALDRFALAVEAEVGPAVAVLGPSGAGKSSLVEAIAGLRPARGRVRLGERLLLDTAAGIDLPPERREVGWVPQDGALFPHLSVRGNLEFARGRRATGPELDEVVASLELEPLLASRPATLSGGERRRVALGRALLSAPRLLLLDEPTAGLDPGRQRSALRWLLQVRARTDVPFLLVTHREEEALALAEEVIVLEEGRVAAHGPARDVLRGEAAAGERARGVNVVAAEVVGHDAAGGVTSVELESGAMVSIAHEPSLPEGGRVLLALDADDVLVAVEEPCGLSARNALAGTVTGLREAGGSVLVEVGPWTARLTRSAARDLGLSVGSRAWVVAKSHGWRVVAG